MSKRSERFRAAVEWGKNALILILVLTALLLLRESGYFNDVLRQASGPASAGFIGQELQEEPAGLTASPIRPLGIHVSTPDGRHIGAGWDAEGVSEMFNGLAAALAEALGSAEKPERIAQSVWQQILLQESVCFDFDSVLPLSLLGSRLGVTPGAAEGYSASLLCLACRGEAVWLCFRSEPDGLLYRCATGGNLQTMRAHLNACQGTEASFAFENSHLEELDPCTIILSELPAVSAAEAAPAIGAVNTGSLMELLGMNSYIVQPYLEADGTLVYVDNKKSLRISPSGAVSFRNTGSGNASEGSGQEGLSGAMALAEQALAGVKGDAGLGFAELGPGLDGGVVYRFRYLVNGIPVELPEGAWAAEITVNAETVTRLELHPRSYTLMGTARTLLLPMPLAAAQAAALGARKLGLVYIDDGTGLTCAWVKQS